MQQRIDEFPASLIDSVRGADQVILQARTQTPTEVAMPERKDHVSYSRELTHDDLHGAYVFCDLRRHGIGMAKVLETPSLEIALRNTAIARKKKQEQAQPQQNLPEAI